MMRDDFRLAVRQLLKSPGFTIVAVITLALGIGANVAIFSVVNAVLLRPLPYPQPDRLVRLWGDLHQAGLNQAGTSAPEFIDLRTQTRSFEQLAAYFWQGRNLTGAERPERLVGARVSANFFSLLGRAPMIGRGFREEEDQPGRSDVVVVSRNLWERLFGIRTPLTDQHLMLDGKVFTVIGVMPADFEFPYRHTDLWMPLALEADELSESSRGSHYLEVIGRLKSGVTLAEAQSELEGVSERLTKAHPLSYPAGLSLRIVLEQDHSVSGVRVALWLLFGSVAGVLLIACANIGNLLLARASTRVNEVAVRTALGASRSRLVRQWLTESLVLATLGALFGLLLARWSMSTLIVLAADHLPRAREIRMDAATLAFAFLGTVLSAVLFGCAPAMQAWSLRVSEALQEGGRNAGIGGRARWRGPLIAGELVLTVMLLIGAGLLLKSFYLVRQVKPGFAPENLLSVRLVLPWEKYPDAARKGAFFQELLERVEVLPGIESAGVVSALPLSDITNDRAFSIENRTGKEGLPGDQLPTADYVVVSTNYFQVMKIPLVRGRSFHEAQDSTTPLVIINQSLAKRFWPNADPLGHRLKLGGRDSPFPWMTIIGVAGDVKHSGLEVETRPEVYVPYLQPRMPAGPVGAMFLVVRSGIDLQELISNIRRVALRLDADQPLVNIETMEERLAESLAARRFSLLLLTLFASLALILAAIGLYGVVAHGVSQRTREIGLRMALGAQRRQVLGMVVRQGMKWVAIGILAGALGALALTRLMRGLLFEISPADPTTFLAMAGLLAFVALVACYLPARHAARLDPMKALRE